MELVYTNTVDDLVALQLYFLITTELYDGSRCC